MSETLLEKLVGPICCAVAFAFCTGIEKDDALKIFPGATELSKLDQVLTNSGFERVTGEKYTPNQWLLKQYAQTHKQGRYILACDGKPAGHAVALIDGKLYNADGWENKKVIRTYKYTKNVSNKKDTAYFDSLVDGDMKYVDYCKDYIKSNYQSLPTSFTEITRDSFKVNMQKYSFEIQIPFFGDDKAVKNTIERAVNKNIKEEKRMNKKVTESYDNYPEKAQIVVDAVDGQLIEDEKELDKRKEDAEKEIEKPIKGVKTFTGREKKFNPDDAIVPRQLEENLFEDADTGNAIQESVEELDENINPADAERTIHLVMKNSFGVDADVHTFKDDDALVVVASVILPSEKNAKMVYDELKEKLYKRFNNQIDISCKTFSSKNLKQGTTEFKIKIFVLKEKKNKPDKNSEYRTYKTDFKNDHTIDSTQSTEQSEPPKQEQQ